MSVPSSGSSTFSHRSNPSIPMAPSLRHPWLRCVRTASPPTAMRARSRGARSAARRAAPANRSWAMNAVASQSSTMYPASSPVRCQLIVVSRRPARFTAATVSTNSGRLAHMSATPSPVRTPRACSARTRRFAFALTSSNVRVPASEISATPSPRWDAQYAASIPRSAAALIASKSGRGVTPWMLAGLSRPRPACRTPRRCRPSPRTGSHRSR